ncbi:MAG: major capsid protein [Proteobacteria bacterium]|nr:major capsid protein [Pseudomonadota bacterium]
MTGNLTYDTAKLVAVVPNLKLSQNFLADRFCPGVGLADTEEIDIDIDVGKRRMSPFVSPLVQGELVESRRYQTNKFKPPYIKDKRAPDLRKPVRRMIGERIGGDMTPMERAMANLQFEMEDQVDMLNRRLEWMAASVLRTGQITVAGKGFPTAVIDFARDSALTITLSGSSKWGVSGNFNADGRDPVPQKNIETWQQLILKKSGAQVSDIVFTPGAWAAFVNAEGVQGAIYYPKLGDQGNSLQIGPTIEKGAAYKGRWGQYDLWLYNDWYVDTSNVEQPMLPDGTVILCGPQMMGTRAFGLILDETFNYGPMAYAPKTYLQDDPSQRIILMQSAPLMIPSRVNACLAATVI